MRRNLASLVVANCLFGLAFGVYELAFPLFLDDRGVRLESIGLVLAAGAIVNFLIVVYGGRLSDLRGRKGVYAAGFLVAGLTNAATPFAPHVAVLAVLKTLQQAGVSIRQSLRGVLVYEAVAAERFSRVFGQMTGLEVICQTAGFACVGMVGLGPTAVLSYRGLFAISAAALAVGMAVFLACFRETRPANVPDLGRLSLRDLLARDLHPKLYLIIASGFIFCIGLTANHALYPLYFRQRLDGPWAADLEAFEGWLRAAWPWAARVWAGGDDGGRFALVSLLAAVHRLGLGIPMFVMAPLIRRRFKGFYVGCLALGGVLTLAVGLVDWTTGSFLAVAIVWPLHDLAGASIWFPIQERFIQEYSRPERRATQVAKVRALMALGLVIGTALAGPLMAVDPALPFTAGGGLIVLASLILLAL